MKTVKITLTSAEIKGIISYLKEVDEITDGSNQEAIDFAIARELHIRMQAALRDPREAISDHINDAQNQVLTK